MKKLLPLACLLLTICSQSHAQCAYGVTITASPSPINGTYPPNTTVTFTLNIGGYTQFGQNWIHGVVLRYNSAWDTSTLQSVAAASACSPDGYWAFYHHETSAYSGLSYGPGYFFDFNNAFIPADGDPGNNLGDQNVNGWCSWNFIWQITTASTMTVPPLNSEIQIYGDGITGYQSNTACDNDIYTIGSLLSDSACAAVLDLNGLPYLGWNNEFVNASYNPMPDSMRWWFSDGSTFTSGNTINKVMLDTGAYQACVAIYSTSGCADTACRNFTVHANPVMSGSHVITGKLFFDANTDGIKQTNEPYVSLPITLNPSSTAALPDSGAFVFFVNPGTYQLSLDNTHHFTTSAGNVTVTSTSVDIGNLGVAANNGVHNGRLDAYDAMKCGAGANVTLTFFNNSDSVVNAHVKTVFNSTAITNLNLTTAPLPDSIVNDTFYVSLNHVPPLSRANIDYHFNSTFQANDSLMWNVWWHASDTLNSFSNTGSMNDYDIVSCTPTTKHVTPQNTTAPNYTKLHTPLAYTFNFTNANSDTARYGWLVDSLSSWLDVNSLQVLDASQPYQAYVQNHVLKFILPLAMLNGSNPLTNQAHAVIGVQPLTSTPNMTTVHNHAQLHYEQQPIVASNTVINTFADSIVILNAVSSVGNDPLRLYPNPVANTFVIVNPESNGALEIADVVGKIYLSQRLSQGMHAMDASGLPQGTYIVTLRSEGKVYRAAFVKQ